MPILRSWGRSSKRNSARDYWNDSRSPAMMTGFHTRNTGTGLPRGSWPPLNTTSSNCNAISTNCATRLQRTPSRSVAQWCQAQSGRKAPHHQLVNESVHKLQRTMPTDHLTRGLSSSVAARFRWTYHKSCRT